MAGQWWSVVSAGYREVVYGGRCHGLVGQAVRLEHLAGTDRDFARHYQSSGEAGRRPLPIFPCTRALVCVDAAAQGLEVMRDLGVVLGGANA